MTAGAEAAPPGASTPVSAVMERTQAEPELSVRKLSQTGYRLEGAFLIRLLRPEWSLVYRNESLRADPGGQVRIPFSVPRPGKYLLKLNAVSPYGEVLAETLTLEITPEAWARKVADFESGGGGFRLEPGLGISFLDYRQTGFADYSALNLTGRLGATLDLQPGSWSLQGDLFATLLPVSRNQEAVLRFIGVDALAGYRPLWLQSPWKLLVSGGVHYTTTAVSAPSPSQALGFVNLAGPQLLPSLQKALPSGDELRGSVKWALITDKLSVLALSNRELALGLGYTRRRPGSRPWALSLDLTDLRIALSGSQVIAKSASLGFSLFY